MTLSVWKITLFGSSLGLLLLAVQCQAVPFWLKLRGQPTWQASNYVHHDTSLVSEKAVDGCKSTNLDSYCCSHTDVESQPWWSVDLGKVYNLVAVRLTSRGECCEERLSQFYIYGSLNSHIPSLDNEKKTCLYRETPIGLAATETLHCSQKTEARYLIIQQPLAYLTLCEVEVQVEDMPFWLNLREQPTWQASDLVGEGVSFVSGMAVDGCKSTNLDSHCCSHTSAESNPWWSVDLGKAYKVVAVRLTSRGECCEERLSQFSIYGSLKSHIPSQDNEKKMCLYRETSIGLGVTETLQCSQEIGARYLIIQQPLAYLTLCEVEVQVEAVPIWLSLGGQPTWQASSFVHSGISLVSGMAVDGCKSTDLDSCCCSHTNAGSNPWWSVDLGKTYKVVAVRLTSIGECCEEQLSQFYIYGSLKSHIPSQDNEKKTCLYRELPIGLGVTKTLYCSERIEARYLIIQQSPEFLTLCEVEVQIED